MTTDEFIEFFFGGFEREDFVDHEVIVGVNATGIGVFGKLKPIGLEVEKPTDVGNLTGAHGVDGNDTFSHIETFFIEVFVVDDADGLFVITRFHADLFMMRRMMFMMSGLDHRFRVMLFDRGV